MCTECGTYPCDDHDDDDTCPGCVGRGTGAVCAMCRLPIPDLFRRSAESPGEYRPGCDDCHHGRMHTHISDNREPDPRHHA